MWTTSDYFIVSVIHPLAVMHQDEDYRHFKKGNLENKDILEVYKSWLIETEFYTNLH